jgi:serine/threonine protein kinase
MSSETKPCLFISYRRADCPDSVKLLFERLERELPRWEVFYDHRSIAPGEPFPELLRAKVTTAAVVLVIIGPSWTRILLERQGKPGIDHVREEIRLALEAGSLVIPVTIENGRLPPAEELAEFEDIAPLRARNALAIRPDPDFDTDLRRLVNEIERIGPPEGSGSVLAGRYKLVEKVGEGGMGEIWRAEQTQPRRTVAVKLIKLGMDTREVLARFDAERQALAVMSHPHIARVFDVGTTERGRPFFAMEYVRGVPITTYCDDKRLNPDQRLKLFQQVCDAVQHAHQKGIIHRDIKPGNVLIEEQNGVPVPKVIDFGLAKALGTRLTDKSLHTAFDRRVGTLEYMSPEQASGGAADIDTRTDIYSLGALLYELLAGEPPFSREELLRAGSKAGELEIQRMIRDEDPRRPSVKLSSSASLPAVAINRQLEPHKLTSILRGDLDWIVMKALEKDRGRRYASASGFADDVGRYLGGDAVQARPPSRVYLLQKYVRRHRGLIASLISIAVLLLGGIVGTSWYAYQTNVAREEAVSQKNQANRKSAEALEAQQKATDARRETGPATCWPTRAGKRTG